MTDATFNVVTAGVQRGYIIYDLDFDDDTLAIELGRVVVDVIYILNGGMPAKSGSVQVQNPYHPKAGYYLDLDNISLDESRDKQALEIGERFVEVLRAIHKEENA